MNKKWFFIGFVVTMVLVLAVGFGGRVVVLAQEIITNNNNENRVVEVNDAPRTFDSPEVYLGPIQSVDGPEIDNQADQVKLSSGALPSELKSDDPQGRNLIPAPDIDMSAVKNFDPVGSQSSIEVLPADEGQTPEGPLAPEAALAATRTLVIPAADFRNDGDWPTCYYFSFGNGYMYGSAGCYMMAPVYLPTGVYIQEMYASVFDNDGVNNIYVNLRRVDNYTGVQTDIVALSTAGASTSIQSLWSGYITTNNSTSFTYSYYVTMGIHGSAIRLYSVRLWY